jgi:hypothetical protein
MKLAGCIPLLVKLLLSLLPISFKRDELIVIDGIKGIQGEQNIIKIDLRLFSNLERVG